MDITPANRRMLLRLHYRSGATMPQKGLSPSQIAMLRQMEEKGLVGRAFRGQWYIRDAGIKLLTSR